MNLQSNKQSGFSMIEVLVAATILVVIVMMLGMLFQQTGIAWRVGVRRADAYSQVRSLIGSIQRDAAKAVHEDAIDDNVRNLLGGSQSFSGGTLSFYTLDANGFSMNAAGVADQSKPKRSVSHITYTTSGRRTETFLIAGGTTETVDTNVRDFATRVGSSSTPSTTLGGFDPVFPSGGSAAVCLPLYVKMTATVTSQGYTLDIGAESAGPDQTWGTDDDIRTWSE